MGYSNSSLVAYTLLSPNHSGLRAKHNKNIAALCSRSVYSRRSGGLVSIKSLPPGCFELWNR